MKRHVGNTQVLLHEDTIGLMPQFRVKKKKALHKLYGKCCGDAL